MKDIVTLFTAILLTIVGIVAVTHSQNQDEETIKSAIDDMSSPESLMKGWMIFQNNRDLPDDLVNKYLLAAIKNNPGFKEEGARMYARMILVEHHAVRTDEGYDLFVQDLKDPWREIKDIATRALFETPVEKQDRTSRMLVDFLTNYMANASDEIGGVRSIFGNTLSTIQSFGARAYGIRDDIKAMAENLTADEDYRDEARYTYLRIVGLNEFLDSYPNPDDHLVESMLESLNRYSGKIRKQTVDDESARDRASSFILNLLKSTDEKVRKNAIQYSNPIAFWYRYYPSDSTKSYYRKLVGALTGLISTETNDETKSLIADKLEKFEEFTNQSIKKK